MKTKGEALIDEDGVITTRTITPFLRTPFNYDTKVVSRETATAQIANIQAQTRNTDANTEVATATAKKLKQKQTSQQTAQQTSANKPKTLKNK